MKNVYTLTPHTACVSSHKSVLLVDDNPHRLARLSTWLELANFSVSVAGTATEGLILARHGEFDLILINSHALGYDGAELCRQIRDLNKRTPSLLYSGEAPNAAPRADWRLTPEQEKGLLPACV